VQTVPPCFWTRRSHPSPPPLATDVGLVRGTLGLLRLRIPSHRMVRRHVSKPSMPGRCRSIIAAFKVTSWVAARPSSPVPAPTTVNPLEAKTLRRMSTTGLLSSTIRIVRAEPAGTLLNGGDRSRVFQGRSEAPRRVAPAFRAPRRFPPKPRPPCRRLRRPSHCSVPGQSHNQGGVLGVVCEQREGAHRGRGPGQHLGTTPIVVGGEIQTGGYVWMTSLVRTSALVAARKVSTPVDFAGDQTNRNCPARLYGRK